MMLHSQEKKEQNTKKRKKNNRFISPHQCATNDSVSEWVNGEGWENIFMYPMFFIHIKNI